MKLTKNSLSYIIKLNILIFFFNFFLYFITSPGSLGGDSQARFIMGKMISENFSFKIDDQHIEAYRSYSVKNDQEEYYFIYSPLIPVIYASCISSSKLLFQHFFSENMLTYIQEFICSNVTILAGVLALLGIFNILIKLRFSNKISFWTIIIIGFTTNFWYQTVFSSLNIVQYSFLIWTLYFIILYELKFRTHLLFLSGIMLSLSILTRIETVVVLPVFLFYFRMKFYKILQIKDILKNISIFLIPVILSIFLLLFYNYFRFHSIFNFGQRNADTLQPNILLGITFLLIDPGYGLIPNTPLIFFMFILTIDRIMKFFHNSLNMLCVFLSFFLTIFYGAYPINFYSEYGPRFLLILVIYGGITFPLFYNKYYHKKIIFYIIVALLFFSFLISLVSTLVTVDRIYYHFGWKDLDKIENFNYRYTHWFTQMESAFSVIKNLSTNLENKDFFITDNIKMDAKDWQARSIAFNFPIYWWFRLFFLGFDLILIFLIPCLTILFLIVLFILILNMLNKAIPDEKINEKSIIS